LFPNLPVNRTRIEPMAVLLFAPAPAVQAPVVPIAWQHLKLYTFPPAVLLLLIYLVRSAQLPYPSGSLLNYFLNYLPLILCL
jgi:hypothetical protein